MRRFLVVFACLSLLSVIVVPTLPPVHAQGPDYGGYRPQYPPIGAYNTVGGRGGDIYFVDTLVWDTGAAARCTGTCAGLATSAVCNTVTCYRGSFKACLGAGGPRYCLPTVSGYINMPSTGGNSYQIFNGNLTVAAQTAPSPGITLRYDGLVASASHVVLQHLRIRVGAPPPDNKPCGGAFNTYTQIPFNYPGQIVFDHVSGSWAKDDNLGIGNAVTGNIMVWRSNFSEPLNYHAEAEMQNPCSGGEGGYPGHCAILGSVMSDALYYVGESVVSNCHERYFRGLGNRSRWVLVNNIIHGFLAFQTVSVGQTPEGFTYEPSRNTIVGNRYIANSATCNDPSGRAFKIDVVNGVLDNQLYHADNSLATVAGCKNMPGEMYIYPTDAGVCTGPGGSCFTYDPTVKSPPAQAPLPTANGWRPRPSDAAMEAFVLANVGARPSDRDSAEIRILNDVVTRTWRSVHSVSEAGGWPVLANNTQALAVPSNPHAIAPGQTFRTNIEVWLEALASDIEGSPLSAPRGVRLLPSSE
jgi:hypothetical protein